MLRNILVNLFLIVLCTLLDLSASQNCNKEIEISEVKKVSIPYYTKESYKGECPFESNIKCTYWRDVKKEKIEDRVVTSTKTIIACCTGYYLVNDRCFPYCKDSCINGVCSAPGYCTCSSGYTKSSVKNNLCNPVCSSCTHGECVAPNTCRCYEGYSLVNDKCLPYCKDPCINGVCSAPGICSCSNGYTKSSENNVCDPDCSSCTHGDCIAPNTCRCHEGYAKNHTSQLCEPHCGDGCGFGTCKAPFRCECYPGFERDENGACTVRACPVECKGGSCQDGDCYCPFGLDWDAEESSCSCPVPPTTLTPTTLFEDDITTEMEVTPEDAYQKDSFWFLVAIIAILSLTLFVILTVIWYKRFFGYRAYNTNSLTTYHATFKL